MAICSTAFAQQHNVGGQKDSHGCLTAAGYQWSELQKKCIRVWEGTITLEKVGPDKTLAAYVYINAAQTSAEVFLPEGSMVLRKRANKEYSNNEYSLATNDGYTLKKKGEIIWKGPAKGNHQSR